MKSIETIRVLHCAESIKGGIATYLRELLPLQCEELGASNILLLIPESQERELPVPKGVQLVTFPDTTCRFRNALSLALLALRLVRKEKIDVVHLHSTFAGALARPLLALLGRSRLVYCAHGWAWDREMAVSAKRAVRAFEKLLSRITDSIVCISEYEKNSAIAAGISGDKLIVVKNAVRSCPPIAENVSLVWPECRLRLLFVGRLDRQKGVDVLLDAMKVLGDEVHALIAGDAVLRDVEKMDMPSNVTRIGWLTPGQLETVFKGAHVLLVPSRWEGFGLIAAEAMRAGLPVIATNVGGLPEVVDHEVSGIIVPPESASALVESIRSLSVDKLQKMGEAGQRRVAVHFSMSRLHNELIAIYKAIT